MDCRQLNVIPVQGLFHHCLMQSSHVLPTGINVQSFRFRRHCHQESTGTASQIGYIKGARELMVAPVHASRPVVEHETGQQGWQQVLRCNKRR